MQGPQTGVVSVGPVGKVAKSPDVNPKDIAGRTAGEIDGIAKQSGLLPKGQIRLPAQEPVWILSVGTSGCRFTQAQVAARTVM